MKEGVGFLSTSERRLLRGLYTRGSAAFGSVANLVKASGLGKRKVLEFLHGLKSYTKFHPAVRKFPRLQARAKHVDEIWCMDLAYMDKLAKWNDGIKYLLVCVDIFSRRIRVQPMKTKSAPSAKSAFMKMLTTTQPKKVWVDQGTEFEGAFSTFCKSVNIKIYHSYSETKAAYAERAIRSLKNMIYRYLEEVETEKYKTKLNDFVKTMNSRVNRSTGKAPNDVNNSDALYLLYGRMVPNKKLKFKAGDFVRISKADIAFRKGYKSQFTNELFQIKRVATKNPPTYEIKDGNGDTIKGKFYERELVLHLD